MSPPYNPKYRYRLMTVGYQNTGGAQCLRYLKIVRAIADDHRA